MPASFAIDIWSLGAIGFSIFARQVPRQEEEQEEAASAGIPYV